MTADITLISIKANDHCELGKSSSQCTAVVSLHPAGLSIKMHSPDAVGAPLDLSMTFRCSENITAAHWEVSYIAGWRPQSCRRAGRPPST